MTYLIISPDVKPVLMKAGPNINEGLITVSSNLVFGSNEL